MTGVIEKCNKNRAEFFFIRGDDGKRYFGHRHQVVNMKHYTQFCYEGNRVKFVPGELPQKEGDNQEANSIEFEPVDKYDMMAKRIREQESEIAELRSMVEFWKNKALHT